MLFTETLTEDVEAEQWPAGPYEFGPNEKVRGQSHLPDAKPLEPAPLWATEP